jgi:Ca-activated chloride channel family protein
MSMSDLSIQLTADRELISDEVPSQRVIELALHAPQAKPKNGRVPLNLAVIIDRSGSMQGQKIENAKKALYHILDLLQESDYLSMVAYDNQVRLLAESTAITAEKHDLFKRIVSELEPGGMTNLSGGWLEGCRQAALVQQEGWLNRALLLTDGIANEGILDLEELGYHASQIYNRGISTSTFGIGEDFNHDLLEHMSNQGGGNFYYIGSPAEIPDIFMREFKDLAAITARDVELTLEIPPHVDIQIPGSWRVESSGKRMILYAGSLVSDATRELYLKVLFPPRSNEDHLTFHIQVKALDEEGKEMHSEAEISFNYASQSETNQCPQRRDVMERFSLVEVAETTNEALKLEKQGRRKEAGHLLKRALQNAQPFLAPACAKEYEQKAEQLSVGLDEEERKDTHYTNYLRRQRRG